MKSFSQLFKAFTPATFVNFPIEECENKDICEDNIFIGTNKYLCLIADRYKVNERSIAILTPYMASIDDRDLFGWLEAQKHSYWVDNIENPIHGSSESRYVIGFIPYGSESEDLYNNEIIFDMFKKLEE